MARNRVETPEQFREAIRENVYAEFTLDGEDAVIVKDVDSDPYVVTSEEYMGEEDLQAVEDLLVDSNVFPFYSLEFDVANSENLSEGGIYHINGVEVEGAPDFF